MNLCGLTLVVRPFCLQLVVGAACAVLNTFFYILPNFLLLLNHYFLLNILLLSTTKNKRVCYLSVEELAVSSFGGGMNPGFQAVIRTFRINNTHMTVYR